MGAPRWLLRLLHRPVERVARRRRTGPGVVRRIESSGEGVRMTGRTCGGLCPGTRDVAIIVYVDLNGTKNDFGARNTLFV